MVVTGRVQGVGYRASCARALAPLGVAGTVRNRPDGSVEVIVEGTAEQLAAAEAWCRQGPPYSKVVAVAVTSEEPEGLAGFRVVR